MIDVVTLRGAGEARLHGGAPNQMTGEVAKNLDESSFTCFEPIWPASVGPIGSTETRGPSLNSSVRLGVDAAAKAIRQSPNVCGIIGYSLGALAASELLHEVAVGTQTNKDGSKLEIAFALLIANPARLPYQHKFEACPGYGIHGKRGETPSGTEVIEVCNPQDVICSAPDLSPLRRLSDGISPFSMLEGARLGDADGQFRAIRKSLTGDRNVEALYHFWSPAFWDRYARAIDGAAGYLFRGDHTNYAKRVVPSHGKTHTQLSAEYLNDNWRNF